MRTNFRKSLGDPRPHKCAFFEPTDSLTNENHLRKWLRPVLSFWLLTLALTVCPACLFARPYRPIVFVPGFLGSVLTANGDVLWGDRGSLFKFSQLALPVDGRSAKVVKALKPIDQIGVFGPFKIHQYDSLYAVLTKEIGFVEGKDLFAFPYDWRQSNFENAERLARYIESRPELHGEFDIVAHSMGGLISRIYIQNYDRGRRVKTLVNLAVPFLGSVDALYTLENGLGPEANLLMGGIAAVREVLLSLPSFYELLPRYAECCIEAADQNRHPIDILAESFWDKYPGLPSTFRSDVGRRFIQEHLKQAREIGTIVSKPLPNQIVERTIVGDLRATHSRAYITPTGLLGSWQQERGDGTVVQLSGANGQLSTANPSFSSHTIIFDDAYVKSLLRTMLDADAGRFKALCYSGSENPASRKRRLRC